MARWIYITPKRLYRRWFMTPGRPIETGSLFPFFDRDGEIASFLLVDPESEELFLVREAETISVPLWGPIRLRSWPELVEEDTIGELAGGIAGDTARQYAQRGQFDPRDLDSALKWINARRTAKGLPLIGLPTTTSEDHSDDDSEVVISLPAPTGFGSPLFYDPMTGSYREGI